MKFKSLLVLFFLIFFSQVSLSNENKLVYIDLNKIMNNSIAGKNISSQLENNHKKNISKLKKIEEKLKKEESEIISQKNVLTKEKYEKKIIDLREKAKEFRTERNENINNLNNQRLEATAKIINLITGKDPPKPRVATLRKINKINTSELIDEGLILWFPGPESYTGEDMAEIHVHGSKAVVDALHSSLSEIENCRLAEPGEFTKIAFQMEK